MISLKEALYILNVETIIINLNDISLIAYIIKTFFISICTHYAFLKIINNKNTLMVNRLLIFIVTIIISIICGIIKYSTDSYTSMLCLILLLSSLYSLSTKRNIGNSILITLTSLSINYIIFFVSVVISIIPNIILTIQNDYTSLLLIFFIHSILLYSLFKIRRFKDGFAFLHKNLKNEYFDILILNISVTILFSSIMLTNLNVLFTRNLFFGFIAFSIVMFITIKKSLLLYYKHNLLIKDLTETKLELEKKNKEIAELEKEILSFMKTSHSIAHKQKSLEYKINELMLKSEIAPEIDISDKISHISDEYFNHTAIIELSKTDIPNIDDMLTFMQSECVKNNIDFELQLIENINHMVNNFVSKQDLEILIADHIKNAIIAINYSDNVNRGILVRLGLINGFYSLYIYDSGIEFEIDTLINLGIKPYTTHSDTGGTGIGFMNTFDTLRKYNASLIINEIGIPSKDNYTKLIMIIFDKKSVFKIVSYRSKNILAKDINNNLIIEQYR